MIAPDIAYRYTMPIDVASPTIELMSRGGSATGAATSVTAEVNGVPQDRILIVTTLGVKLNPGATQEVLECQIFGTTGAGANFVFSWTTYPETADKNESARFSGEIWIQGQGVDVTSLSILGVFSAGVNANSVSFGMQGIVIPRGNTAAF